MIKKVIIDGDQFTDMDGFYSYIYSLMALYPDWYPGYNLDALNDMLYSGFGTEEVRLIWKNAQKSMNELGIIATKEFYQKKIDHGAPYNVEWATEKIRELERGEGETLFEIILSIFGDHNNLLVELE